MFLPLPWFYESVLLFRGSNKTGCQINCSSFISNRWCFRLFPHSYWNFVSLYLMKTPVGLVVIWIGDLSAIWALGVYGSIGRKYIKIHLVLAFLFTCLCLYIHIYIHVHFLCLCAQLYATGLLEVVQSVFRTFCLHSELGLFQGQVHISSFGSWLSWP